VTHFIEANCAAATTNRRVWPPRRASISNSRVASTPSSRRISAVMRAVKLASGSVMGGAPRPLDLSRKSPCALAI